MDGIREVALLLVTAEKDLARAIARLSMIGDHQTHELISTEVNDVNQMVKEERVNLQQGVMDCRHQVSLCTVPEIDSDLNELGERLEAARTALFGWKRSQGESFEELIRQEETLSREVGALLVRVDAAERKKMRAPTRQSVRTPRDTGSRPEAIQKLQDFQAKHGPTDGWNAADHSAFVRMWNRQCDTENDIWDEERFIAAVEADLPGRPAEDIARHIQYYRTLLKLQRNQKHEIEAWRAARQVARLTKAAAHLAATTPRKLSKREEASREKRLKELDAWKARKAEEKERRERENQRLNEKERKRRAQEAAQRERILKLREIERSHRREAEKLIKQAEQREAEEAKKHRAAEANRVLREVTAKDVYDRQLEITRRKQREREEQIQAQLSELKRQRRNDRLAEFDPTRLYQATMAQRIRATTTSTEKNANQGRSFILHRGGRAPVSWRSGL